ncbi:MAG: phenylalanine--tRNA ligase subunit beta, partial [Myxococcota bacterium]|nr:phenylalanine--tRNA ligase subunit beta [Myxococcota bacterium]
MRVSHKWICEIAGLSAQPEELAERLTFAGLEVEGVTELGVGLDKIVVAEVRSKKPHPKKDTLSIVEVDSGAAMHQVVCGASNCPGTGGRVVLAMPGAKLGSLCIETRPLLGVQSEGMLCCEAELGIGPDQEGILLLGQDTPARIGSPIVEALDLRDSVLDVGITPNRADALSHRGIARDAALLLGGVLEPRIAAALGELDRDIRDFFAVEIHDPEGCPRYGAAAVLGVTVRPSRFALRYRLYSLGIRPISNIVDMTNLVLLEFGQPLHAFDLDKLEARRIIVSRAAQGERMITLDGQERTLSSSDLLIRDGERPVAIAGVMGGNDSGVNASTKNVLIECAYFTPTWVRRTAKRLRVSSESGYRFERGVDPCQGPQVLEAAVADTLMMAGGKAAAGFIDCYPRPVEPLKVRLRPGRFKQVMGYDVPVSAMTSILTGLGAKVASFNGEGLKVTVPTSRPDIEREIDLVEEIARIRGLEEVPSTLPRIRCSIPHREAFEAARRTKELLVRLGM